MYGNPFSEFLVSDDFLLIGRDGTLREVAQVITMANPDHRDLHGLAGMGKSNMLRYISGPEFIEEYKSAFLPPYNKQPYRLFRPYIAGWIEIIHPTIFLYREFAKAYRKFRADLQVEDPQVVLPDLAVEMRDDLGRDEAMSLMETMLHALSVQDIGVAILLDDFDSDLAYGRFNADEVARLTSWMDYCSFIVATERRLEDVNPAAKGSPLYKRLTQTPVRELLPDEARAFLLAVLDRVGASLPGEDIENLVELVGGFSYLLILAGRELWELRRRMRLEKSPDGLPEALKPYFEDSLSGELRRMFEVYYAGRTEVQRDLLRELGAKGSLSLQTGGESRRYIQLMSLASYDLVKLDNDGRVFPFSPLFGRYLASLSAESVRPAPAGSAPALTRLQTDLYHLFRSRPREVLTFEELGRKFWSWPADSTWEPPEEDTHKIRMAVSKLRRELEESATGERIVNVRSRGYRYEPAA